MITSWGFNVSHMGFRIGTTVAGAPNQKDESHSYKLKGGANGDGFGVKGSDARAVGADNGNSRSEDGVIVEAV